MTPLTTFLARPVTSSLNALTKAIPAYRISLRRAMRPSCRSLHGFDMHGLVHNARYRSRDFLERPENDDVSVCRHQTHISQTVPYIHRAIYTSTRHFTVITTAIIQPQVHLSDNGKLHHNLLNTSWPHQEYLTITFPRGNVSLGTFPIYARRQASHARPARSTMVSRTHFRQTTTARRHSHRRQRRQDHKP